MTLTQLMVNMFTIHSIFYKNLKNLEIDFKLKLFYFSTILSLLVIIKNSYKKECIFSILTLWVRGGSDLTRQK